METLSVLYFPAAFVLGALHALEPGHAKALTAAYLIGINGTKRDALILGLSVAVTHSVIVILISLTGLWLGNEAFSGEATKWLERGSGLVAIGIGCWMLFRRLAKKNKVKINFKINSHSHGHAHDHSHDHSHDHLDDVAHAKLHMDQFPDYVKRGEKPSLLQIVSFGAAGGMIPCPASITVMLLALSVGKIGMGLFTVLGFSLGLAVTLVSVGMLIVTGLSKLEEKGKLSIFTKKAPLISACLVIVSGLFALFISR